MVRQYLGRLAALFITYCLLIAVCGTSEPDADRLILPPDDDHAQRSNACHVAPLDASADILLPVARVTQHIPYAEDENSNLCWAAGIAMVSNYLGKPVDLCNVAEMRPHGLLMNCCRSPETIGLASIILCNQGASAADIDTALRRLGMYNTHVKSALPEDLLVDELAHGRPVYVDRENSEVHTIFGFTYRGRHVVVIIGRIEGTYVVLDPSPSEHAPQYLTYLELRHGIDGQKEWRETWYGLSFRSDRCNPLFIPDCRCEAP